MLASLDDTLDSSRKSHLPIRDGAPRAEVDVFGQAFLRRSKQSRRQGKLEVSTLQGKFTIADLVEPELDTLTARDNLRIKAVIQLTRAAEAKAELFYPLVGSQETFDKYVPSEALDTLDLVAMAGKVKSWLEKAARAKEQESETLSAKAEAARLTSSDADSEEPYDEIELSNAYEEATREESRLQAEAKAYQEAEQKRDQSIKELDKLKKEYKGRDLGAAANIQKVTGRYVELATDKVEELMTKLVEAEKALKEAQHQKELADSELGTAQAHHSAVDALQRVIDTSLPDSVIQLDLDTASNSVKIARKAAERGALIRKARLDRGNALKRKYEAETAKSEGELLRDAAKATDNVLAEVVQSLGVPLSVLDSRLWVTDSTRTPNGLELFEELSRGERTNIVIDIAIKAVGQGGMFVIPQEFFEGLTESNIIALAEKLKNTGVLAITARAVDGEGITARVVESSLSLD